MSHDLKPAEKIPCPMRRAALIVALALVHVLGLAHSPSASAAPFTATKDKDRLTVQNAAGVTILQYQLQPPAQSDLSVKSACYFHPFTSPSGTVLTDVAPSDHRHHRGIFLAWVETHGKKDADFWGWGEHAPVEGVVIENQRATIRASASGKVRLTARNHWKAKDHVMLVEDLTAQLSEVESAYVLDLVYELRPTASLTLSQWAFSGFCVRGRKDGEVAMLDRNGPARHPAPIHTKPESNWPNRPWYAMDLTLPGGDTGGGTRSAGVAVINHAANPEASWHNHPDLRMLNPAITGPREVKLRGFRVTRLRYRVVSYDGPAPMDLLNRLSSQWSGSRGQRVRSIQRSEVNR